MQQVVEVVRRARGLVDDLRPADALVELSAVSAPPPPADQSLLLARAAALGGGEQLRASYDIATRLLDRRDLGAAERAETLLHKARALRKVSSLVDQGLLAALEASAISEAAPDVVVEARLEAALLWSRKRCRRLAEGQLDVAARLAVADPRTLVYRGFVLLDCDERAAARREFERALALDARGSRWGRISLAHLATLSGEFQAAHAHLDALGTLPPGDLWARNVRARLYASEGRWAAAAAAFHDLRSAAPQSDFAARYAYERASALYRAAQREPALGAFHELADREGDQHYGRLSRRTARLLDRDGAAGLPRRRLPEFPSVTQLRNHCGPACCELYLRFLGTPANQIEIAREIKFPDGGTPVYRVRRYLEKAGFHTRRVEATLPVIKRLIDAGVPVLMEEDYSDSRHVAIAIGYDDAREVLEVQDPMTHEVRETFYEDLPRIRDLSNDGALVAVPSGDSVRLAALEAAGAVECRYMGLVDEAWAAYHDGRGDDGDRLVTESLSLRRDYELSWFYAFRRARERVNAAATPEHKASLQKLLADITALWPDDEWPQQFVGETLYFDGRHEEALQAFERARDRDDPDPHNWSMMADCLLALGRYDEAESALGKALERDAAHVRANENLAWVANRKGEVARAWLLNDCARELHPQNPFNHTVHGALLVRRGDLAGGLLAYERALELDSNRRDALIERAKLLAKLGRLDEGRDALAARIAATPDDLGLRVELADLLYEHERAAECVEVCRALLAKSDKIASGYAILGAALCQKGDLDGGIATLKQALAVRPIYSWVYAQKGKHLARARRFDEAIESYAAALGLSGGDPRFQYEFGEVLAWAGQADDGLEWMRRAALRTRLDEVQLARLGKLMFLRQSAGAAHEFFGELGANRPEDLAVLRAHARTLLDAMWAPGAARPVLQKIARLAPEDEFALALRGMTLLDEALASEQEGERLLRAAIALSPELAYPRRILADRLSDRGRFAEALTVLEGAGAEGPSEQLRVVALCGLGKLDEADALVAAFARRDRPEAPSAATLRMRYAIARRRWSFRAALELAEQLARATGERDDDGELDYWEREKFECLAYLAEDERALRFGESQAQRGHDLARLAYCALGADRVALASELAERAVRLTPDDTQALHVKARLAELAGDVEGALHRWRRIGELEPDWHLWHENLARVALGRGEVQLAAEEAEAAIAGGGHVCPHAFALRAQVRLLKSDREGALADLERSWALAKPESREHEDEGTWAMRALLQGERSRAGELFAVYLREGAPISPLDRARIARVREVAEQTAGSRAETQSAASG
jgi:tetratricopeptide (TPR) repeat protein